MSHSSTRRALLLAAAASQQKEQPLSQHAEPQALHQPQLQSQEPLLHPPRPSSATTVKPRFGTASPTPPLFRRGSAAAASMLSAGTLEQPHVTPTQTDHPSTTGSSLAIAHPSTVSQSEAPATVSSPPVSSQGTMSRPQFRPSIRSLPAGRGLHALAGSGVGGPPSPLPAQGLPPLQPQTTDAGLLADRASLNAAGPAAAMLADAGSAMQADQCRMVAETVASAATAPALEGHSLSVSMSTAESSSLKKRSRDLSLQSPVAAAVAEADAVSSSSVTAASRPSVAVADRGNSGSTSAGKRSQASAAAVRFEFESTPLADYARFVGVGGEMRPSKLKQQEERKERRLVAKAAAAAAPPLPEDPQDRPQTLPQAAGAVAGSSSSAGVDPQRKRKKRAAFLGPSVIMVEGVLQVDPASMVVSAGGQTLDPDSLERVEETNKRVTSSTYLKRRRGPKWSPEETEQFYDALRMFGTDFSTLCLLFPSRTRRQIKSKYSREDKIHPSRVEAALRGHLEPTPLELERILKLAKESDRLDAEEEDDDDDDEEADEEDSGNEGRPQGAADGVMEEGAGRRVGQNGSPPALL